MVYIICTLPVLEDLLYCLAWQVTVDECTGVCARWLVMLSGLTGSRHWRSFTGRLGLHAGNTLGRMDTVGANKAKNVTDLC